jgi:glyoxylase-like metal-dependent hydrolase (beta-lactamase superfamily II)
MIVTTLKKNPGVYTSNVYHVRGDWNALSDVNTLIDVGADSFILEEINNLSTGVGKRRVELVIITHEHFDHTAGLQSIITEFKPEVLAYSNQLKGVTRKLKDGMKVKIADREAEIIYTPGHSNDSICIYCMQERVLFSGDTPLNIKTPGGSYTNEFVEVLRRLIKLDIRTIYSGHDTPLDNTNNQILNYTLKNVLKSRLD